MSDTAAAVPPGSPVQALIYYNRALAYLGARDERHALQDFQAAQAICRLPANANDESCVGVRWGLSGLAQQ